jgi:hypothetical protein
MEERVKATVLSHVKILYKHVKIVAVSAPATKLHNCPQTLKILLHDYLSSELARRIH